jgi:hypothetical protein
MDAKTDHREERVHGFLRDEDGSSMVEFVMVAPILCYMMIAVFFFHHHIDYAQDATFRFRNLTWKHVPPRECAQTHDQDSDANGFNGSLGMTIRTQVQMGAIAGVGGISGIGSALAFERFYGGTPRTPYGRLAMPHDNYWTKQEPVADIPDNPWAPLLAGFGRFFGHRIGGGDWKIPRGYDVNWEEKFPIIVNPWMRYLERGPFTELAITKAPGMEAVMNIMDGLTLFRSKTFSDVHKVDSTMDGNTRENALQMKGGNMESIVK